MGDIAYLDEAEEEADRQRRIEAIGRRIKEKQK